MEVHKSTLLDVMHFTGLLMQLTDWDEVYGRVGRQDYQAQMYCVMRQAIADMEKANPEIASKCGYEGRIG